MTVVVISIKSKNPRCKRGFFFVLFPREDIKYPFYSFKQSLGQEKHYDSGSHVALSLKNNNEEPRLHQSGANPAPCIIFISRHLQGAFRPAAPPQNPLWWQA